jgi:transaldolase
MAIEAGATGCTQNPTYVWKIMQNEEEKQHILSELNSLLKEEPDDNKVLISLQRNLVSKIAKIFLPMFTESHGKMGYVSIQGDPFKEDVESILQSARYNREAGYNIMAKVPATEDGLEAIKILAAECVPINATEIMAVQQALDVCEIYKKATAGLKNPAPLYISVITGIYDEYLQRYVRDKNIDICPDILWQAGISIAKKIYWMVKERNYPVGFIGGGARGLHHFTEMVGSEYCITINWEGMANELIKLNPMVVQRFYQQTPFSVEDELLQKVEDFRRAFLTNAIQKHEYEEFGPVVYFRRSFEKAWANALDFIKERRNNT